MIDSRQARIIKLLARLQKGIVPASRTNCGTGPLSSIQVGAENWGRVSGYLTKRQCRLANLWGEDRGETLRVSVCMEKHGVYFLITADISKDLPEIESWSGAYPGANRLERHAHDMLGLIFTHSPDNRRWTRHQAWPDGYFPLRHDPVPFQTSTSGTPADAAYPFHRIEGDAVYEIPVGPVHAGVIEPGHFRFHAVGESVLNLEQRLGYVHKGIEKLAEGRDVDGLLRLASRVSGDSTVAHAWAAAQAAERAAVVTPPERAQFLRALFCERERIANHLGDIGAICNDVGFTFAHMQFSRLRELWLRRHYELLGHRLLMDCIVPGGVRSDLDQNATSILRADIEILSREITDLESILSENLSLRDRLIDTGVLRKEHAQRLGCLGIVARASGLPYDVRVDSAYTPYEQLDIERPLQQQGDVAARVMQRQREIYASLSILRQLLEKLPHGPIKTPWKNPSVDAAGIGIVEGWRGEIVTFLRFDIEGKVSRFFPRDPSWFNWPALEILIHGNIVPDFPVCNKSVNGSYSGCDL